MNSARALALQTWFAWGIAASMPLMLGRNPITMALVSVVIATVAIVHHDGGSVVARGLLFRSVAFIAFFTVTFNVLTARTGNQVIVEIPDAFRVLAGPITWNAVVYGLLSAWALIGLIAIWTTVGRNVSWSSLARLLPDRLTGFAVAGSTAINLIPQTAHAVSEIREATAVRGFNPNGARGIARLITPVVNGGLDRSMRMAEVLESRGFGSRPAIHARSSKQDQLVWGLLIGGGFIAVYGFSAGVWWAAVAGVFALLVAAGLLRRTNPNAVRRTRYREEALHSADWVVTVSSAVCVVSLVVASTASPSSFRYEPYPDIEMPVANAIALIPIPLLLAPALFPNGRLHADD